MADATVLHPAGATLGSLPGWPEPMHANAGLLWDRYLSVWGGPPESPTRSQLLEPLQAFVASFNRRGEGNQAWKLLQVLNERTERATETWSSRDGPLRARKVDRRVQWRLAVGLGSAHPTNNGFCFDPVVGVPYLPGSSVKGLCRTMACLMEHPDIDRLFGPGSIAQHVRASKGDLVFFDAYPSRWPRLVVDIVNCHHPSYYKEVAKSEKGKSQTRDSEPAYGPSETEDPQPVFFLAVDRDTELTFRMAGPEVDLDTAVELLEQGLEFLGIGAKNAVGYGSMVGNEEKLETGDDGETGPGSGDERFPTEVWPGAQLRYQPGGGGVLDAFYRDRCAQTRGDAARNLLIELERRGVNVNRLRKRGLQLDVEVQSIGRVWRIAAIP